MSGGEANGRSSSSRRSIKLLCPAVSKVVQLVTWEEQRLDLGSIATTFGLDPATLRLNGHFISRGVDLIASSVTWKSLLSFFSAKGLSTGLDDSDALIVDGKLCKAGTKRSHTHDVENGICSISEEVDINKSPHLETIYLMKKKKMSDSNSSDGCEDGGLKMANCSGVGLKRKHWLEDVKLLKKLKMNETHLDALPSNLQGRVDGNSDSISKTQSPCSFMSKNLKRMKEDEVVVTAPCKKIR